MTLARSLGTQWFATIYVACISIGLTFLLGRWLGPEIFGKYSYILTIASLFAILQDGGFRTLLFREGTSPSLPLKAQEIFSMALGHLLALTFIGLPLGLLVPSEDRLTMTLAFCTFGLGVMSNFISARLKGMGKFEDEARWRVLIRSLSAFSILIFITYVSPDPRWVFTGWLLGYGIAFLFRPGNFKYRVLFSKPDSRIYRSIGFLVIIDIATLIYFKIDIVMLKHMGQDLQQVGFYAAASRILEGIVFLLFPLANVLFRDLRLLSQNTARFIRLINKLMSIAFGSALLIIPLGIFFGETILTFCFGSEYGEGSHILTWLWISLIFMVPNLILTQGSLAMNQEKYYARGACWAAVLNVILNFTLIPAYGAAGAALGTLATEAFLTFFLGWGIYFRFLKERNSENEAEKHNCLT